MTVQKAKDLLEGVYDYVLPKGKDRARFFENAIDTAIESMEKQIPKKIIRQKGECYGITKDGKEWHEILLLCPNCHRAIIRTEALDVHCKYCGQKIDWEEGVTSD